MYQGRKSWAIAVLPDNAQGEFWRPAVDVFRTADGWLLRFDLAGVRAEDVVITRQLSRIRVSGARRDQLVERGWTYYSMEIAWTRFERTIELPCNVEEARLEMQLHNGILLVRVVTSE
ncbi:MAG TPA: Hsp20/alpha crystallin family protein [Bryobacteraceae bacterium]|nr:Hsp20/alpha crystallin family protein [Bryobacteraceae bacterium]